MDVLFTLCRCGMTGSPEKALPVRAASLPGTPRTQTRHILQEVQGKVKWAKYVILLTEKAWLVSRIDELQAQIG